MEKSSRTRVMAVLNEIGPEVRDTPAATGLPCGQMTSPYSICLRPRLPSLECPKRGQGAVASLRPGRRQAEHRDPALAQVPRRELLLDLALPSGQPVHRGIDLVGAGAGHREVGAERGVP
jgi:hypothetical protein